ncbi:MAG: BamA/TamA family outer membrane protein [Bacteroidetes bacterium]|nr:BamA/TamA family outer membrane protein [Bacteroidota bacterium]
MRTLKFILLLSFLTGTFFSQNTLPDSLKKLPFAIAKEKKLPEDELADKKEGVYVTGVPDISSDPINGFGYGGEGALFFNGKRSDPFFEYTPYRAELSLALFNTTNNQREAKLGLDVPYIFNTKWRLRAVAAYETNPNYLYFGITEESLKPLSYYPNNDTLKPLVQNSSFSNYDNNLVGNKLFYNTYTKTEAVLNASLERSFLEGKLRTLVGFEYAHIAISTPLNPNNSLVRNDSYSKKIIGIGSYGLTLLQLGIIYDTRDLETDPTKGVFAEITHEQSLVALGSTYNFNKTFLHASVFQPFLPGTFKRMILCGSFGLSSTDGNAPFLEYSDGWGSEGDIDCVGGGRTLRGYKMYRFVAPVIQYADFEIRYRFAQLNLLKQHLAFSAVPFFDEGGVWNNFSRIVHTENIRYSEGLGLRIAWNVNTILRFDYAVSKEDHQFFFQFGHTF